MSSQAPALTRPSALRQPLRLLASVLSLRYLLLRAATAGGAVAFGLVQTLCSPVSSARTNSRSIS